MISHPLTYAGEPAAVARVVVPHRCGAAMKTLLPGRPLVLLYLLATAMALAAALLEYVAGGGVSITLLAGALFCAILAGVQWRRGRAGDG